jgi:hypothetical protein
MKILWDTVKLSCDIIILVLYMHVNVHSKEKMSLNIGIYDIGSES